MVEVCFVAGLCGLAGAMIGGAVQGVISHWLDTPRPVPRARWRVGPEEMIQQDREHLRAWRERNRNGQRQGKWRAGRAD